jgi:hypothetical protein
MGRQLLECREKYVAAMCDANPKDGACGKARARMMGDGIFDAIRGRTNEDEFDVIARVDGAMVECAREMGLEYQQKVWLVGS